MNQILGVVSMSPDMALKWINYVTGPSQLSMGEKRNFNTENGSKKSLTKHMVEACQQIANRLLHAAKSLETLDIQKALSLVKLLNLMAKFLSTVLEEHIMILLPIPSIADNTASGIKLVCGVTELLEEMVPLMEHPSKIFLTRLEKHLVTSALNKSDEVARSCFSCLSTIVNKIAKDFALIRRICAG